MQAFGRRDVGGERPRVVSYHVVREDFFGRDGVIAQWAAMTVHCRVCGWRVGRRSCSCLDCGPQILDLQAKLGYRPGPKELGRTDNQINL